MLASLIDCKSEATKDGRNAGGELSALEQRYSRIARELSVRWEEGDIDAYLNCLLLDDRGDRQGFPAEVLEELMFLSSLRWQLQNPQHCRADQCLVDQFSFNPTSDLKPSGAPQPGVVI